LLARPENAELHLAAGRQSFENKDVSRAEKEFEEAIKLAGLPEAFEELAKLHEGEQDLRKALALYRSGLATANGDHTIALEQLQQLSADAADPEVAENSDESKVKEGELIPNKDA